VGEVVWDKVSDVRLEVYKNNDQQLWDVRSARHAGKSKLVISGLIMLNYSWVSIILGWTNNMCNTPQGKEAEGQKQKVPSIIFGL